MLYAQGRTRVEEVADDEEVDVGDAEPLEGGEEQHQDPDPQGLPHHLQRHVLLHGPAQRGAREQVHQPARPEAEEVDRVSPWQYPSCT